MTGSQLVHQGFAVLGHVVRAPAGAISWAFSCPGRTQLGASEGSDRDTSTGAVKMKGASDLAINVSAVVHRPGSTCARDRVRSTEACREPATTCDEEL